MNPQHSSETVEHFTPPEVVAHARRTLGGFDLDPASCELANEYVDADAYYDAVDDGFKLPWFGRVFLNPPGGLCDEDGRPVYPATKRRRGCSETGACGLPPGHAHRGVTSSARAWWFKLMAEVFAGRVEAAYFVGFSLELMQSAQCDTPEVNGSPLPLPQDFAHLVPRRRLRFLSLREGRLVPGDNATHANVLVYVGPRDGLTGFATGGGGPRPIGRVVAPFFDCWAEPGEPCWETRGWCQRAHSPKPALARGAY